MNLDPDEFEARLARQLNDLADTPLPGRKSIAEVTSAAVRDRGPVSTSVLVATALLLAVGAVLFAVRADLRWPGPSPAEGEGLGSIPAGITADQWNYCMTKAVTGWQSSMGPETVEEVGRNYLGWDTELANREELMSAAELAAHPEGGLACRVANELFALSEPEWNWCYDEANRAAFLVPAIAALGLGEDEARSPAADGLAEAPGDDVPEYVFACRFAFQYWREEGVSEVVSPASHPYFALTADQAAWCANTDNRDVLEWAAAKLGIETPLKAPALQQVTAYVRACRVARLAQDIPPPQPPIAHVRDGAHIFSPSVVASAENRLLAIDRSTGFAGILITQVTDNGSGYSPEFDLLRHKLVVTFSTASQDGCCALLGSSDLDLSDNLQPVSEPLNAGDYDEGLQAFVEYIDHLAGDPEPAPRRIPEAP
jgi:hypothetical protein